MTQTGWWSEAAATINSDIRQQASERQNQLTKPPGSLGALEDIAISFAGFQGQVKPQLEKPAAVVFAGDHGVVAQGVSAFPQCNPSSSLCKGITEFLGDIAYNTIVQNILAQSNYFRDPTHIPQYLEFAQYLPDLNNEKNATNPGA